MYCVGAAAIPGIADGCIKSVGGLFQCDSCSLFGKCVGEERRGVLEVTRTVFVRDLQGEEEVFKSESGG